MKPGDKVWYTPMESIIPLKATVVEVTDNIVTLDCALGRVEAADYEVEYESS